MPRVSHHEKGGLNLLELLYRNQILVHLCYSQDERQALQRLGQAFRQAVEEKGFTGYEAERLIHCGLCMTEVYAADDAGFLEQAGFGWPAGLTAELALRIDEHNCNFLSAMVVALTRTRNSDEMRGAVDDLIDLAVQEGHRLRAASPTVRLRLAERVFAAQYPEAPVNVFGWLAALGVVTPGKYSPPSEAALHTYDEQAFRAALLCEFDSIRKWFVGVKGSKESVRAQYARLVTSRDPRVIEAMCDVEDAAGRRVHLPELKNKIWALPPPGKWGLDHKDFIKNAFARLPALAPGYRGLLQKKSTAVTDIAGAMMRINLKVKGEESLARFNHGEDNRHEAQLVREVMAQRGFRIGGRTIHAHNRSSVDEHVATLERYYAMLATGTYVPPAELEDSRLIATFGRTREPGDVE